MGSTAPLGPHEAESIEVGYGLHEDGLAQESSFGSQSPSPSHSYSYSQTNIQVALPQSSLANPKSRFSGFTPPAPLARERAALDTLMEALQRQGTGKPKKQDFIEFELDQFAFYVNTEFYPFEMRPLHHLATKKGHGTFYFDGVLTFGDLKFYLTQVEVVGLPIGNYGASHHSVGGHVWARSRRNAREEIYYKLKEPAIEYRRYHAPFLWVADLSKHVVDFCSWMLQRKQEVSILSFKQKFINWALKAHQASPAFQRWRRGHPSDDFRTSVMANIEFIWKEMNGVLGHRDVSRLNLFKETIHFNRWKPDIRPAPVRIREGKYEEAVTIVTPYIMECFGHMVLGKILRVGGPGAEEASLRAKEESRRAVTRPSETTKAPGSRRSHTSFLSKEMVDLIQVGDTISTPRDHEDVTDTKWERMSSKDGVEDERWFGLVQKIHVSPKNGSKSFDVTWFYRPVETPCCMMRYPWPNELFLSDHCTCEDGPSARVKASEILGTHKVDWFGDPSNPKGEFVVRQIYIAEKRRWTTLNRSHLRCTHEPPRLGFKVGETVLATLSPSESQLEAYEVVKIFKQDTTRFVRLRKLLRRKDVEPHVPSVAPNELVYTDHLVVTKPAKIAGKCYVRFFEPGTPIPVPYSKGGTGNMFFVTSQLRVSDDGLYTCVPFDDGFPNTLRQGFDPDNAQAPKLRGLDLFCGSGNFGRGLEEGGAVEMRWVNDIWDKAIHTYMANASNPDTAQPFLGSVDDLLQLAMEGKFADNVPRPGDVDFISGGSPCPGFSLLTPDKTTLRQVKNQSLVASFASFVDFYRPSYGILENVVTIVQSKQNRKQDVLSQLFCALVGLGYQAQLIMGDAWSHGAPQSRSRVFLYFAAPGLSLPEAPRPSHSHYPRTKNHALGKMCNGEPFVSRIFGPTPFKYVSAGESTADLPPIWDGTPDSCVPFPDHCFSAGVTYERRREFAVIPTHPSGLGFARAWNQGKGVMTPAEREMFPADGERVSPISSGWSRVRPNDTFPTVTTASNPTDARLSAGLHWAENRPITIQEVRRAQGFPDEEVLLGNRAQQWKLVGNSVARQVAIALGLQLREAWLGSLYDEPRTGANKVGIENDDAPTPITNTPYSRLQSILADSDETTDQTAPPREFTPTTAISSTSTETSRSGSSRGKKRPLSATLFADIHSRRDKMRRHEEPRSDFPTEQEDSLRDSTPALIGSDLEVEVQYVMDIPQEQEVKINGVTVVRL